MATLYIIATPIGNLEDLSFRALRILKEVDLILCEDTRVTKKLLSHYKISKPTISYHQHSKLTKIERILEQLKKDKNLALVSDAGTPCISDPGAKLIDYLVKEQPDLKIIPIPGPSALISALSISGFSADKFIFLGFPPAKKKRKKFFQEVSNMEKTVIFYESIHRIKKTLEELKNALENERRIVVCRELTKKFETVYRGDIEEIIEQINLLPKEEFKGEFVVIVEK
ncbi:MAG: 16S rRNA (cytidine(1402)-2'-O)-methyltransferase [Parcubacteria group bacterium]|nr:16S rRNA (cytidine(1402)-2'-O)-methyltransferase [Parcubacteria group bacterium]